MNKLSLRQLRYFDALAEHRHFGRAAEACAISQPALSMQIQELEQALGARVLERSTRKVWLTALGEEFARRVRDILRSVDELSDLARNSQEQLAGRLRLGIISTVAPYMLPAVIGELNRVHPELDLHIRESVTTTLLRELSAGHIDLAVVALPISDPALTEIALFDEAFLLVRPLAEAHRPVPNAEMLRSMRLLLLEEGHCFREQALAFCGVNATRPREMLEGSSLATLVQMVGAGIGVTLIPEMAVPIETRAAAVSVDRFNGPEPVRTIGLIWRRTNPLAGKFERIGQIVRDCWLDAGNSTSRSDG